MDRREQGLTVSYNSKESTFKGGEMQTIANPSILDGENIFNQRQPAIGKVYQSENRRDELPEKLNADFAHKYKSGESSVVMFNAQRASENAQSGRNLGDSAITGSHRMKAEDLESYI